MTERVCKRCGTNESVETHHIKYVPEEKITLCRKCHNIVHQNKESEFHPKQKPDELFDPSGFDGVPAKANVTIKRINNNSYFYFNWREGESIKSKFICDVADVEQFTNLTQVKLTEL